MTKDSQNRRQQFNAQTKIISSLKKDLVNKDIVKPALNEASAKRINFEASSPKLRSKYSCMGMIWCKVQTPKNRKIIYSCMIGF